MIETYYKISNIRYKKNPSYNCVLTSKEKGVIVGTVRLIMQKRGMILQKFLVFKSGKFHYQHNLLEQ